MSGAFAASLGRGVTEKRYLRCSGSTAWMSHRCLHRNEGRRCRALRQGAVLIDDDPLAKRAHAHMKAGS